MFLKLQVLQLTLHLMQEALALAHQFHHLPLLAPSQPYRIYRLCLSALKLLLSWLQFHCSTEFNDMAEK